MENENEPVLNPTETEKLQLENLQLKAVLAQNELKALKAAYEALVEKIKQREVVPPKEKK